MGNCWVHQQYYWVHLATPTPRGKPGRSGRLFWQIGRRLILGICKYMCPKFSVWLCTEWVLHSIACHCHWYAIIYHDTNKALTMPTWHCQGLRVALPATHFTAQKCLFTVHLLFFFVFCCRFSYPWFFLQSRGTLNLFFGLFPFCLGLRCWSHFHFSDFDCAFQFSPLWICSPWFPLFALVFFYQQSFALPFFFLIFVFRFQLDSTCMMVFYFLRTKTNQKVRPFLS